MHLFKSKLVIIGMMAVGLTVCPSLLMAQRNTFSPYSRFGYGLLNRPEIGAAGAMGGTGIGVREATAIDPLNPASFSAVDSMTFLFDFSFSGQVASFHENGKSADSWNYGMDYVALKFPLARHWGLSAGLYPYSSVGYSFSEQGVLPALEGESETAFTRNTSASGGLNNFYLGTSVAILRHLALGVTWNYRFGTLQYDNVLGYPSSTIYKNTSVSNALHLTQSSFELGAQLYHTFAGKHTLVLGATYELSMPFHSEFSKTMTAVDTLVRYSDYDFSTPNTLGVGISYTFDRRLTVAVDYSQQDWSRQPFYSVKDSLSDLRRMSLGVEYLPSRLGEYYYQVIKYRAGLHYSESYLSFAGVQLRNVGLSVGAGLPLRQQRSMLNVAFEAGKTLTPSADFLQENYCKLSMGITFNENWFVKRRFR